jgi:AraC-like DNA-binding protein
MEVFMSDYQKRGYLLENFRLFHLNSPGGADVEYHYHEFCKLLLLVSGRGGYMVDSQRYLLQPGDVVLIGSRSVHRPELAEDSPYERVIIYIDPGFLQGFSGADCDLLGLLSGSKGHVLRLKESQRKKVFSLASALEKELSGDSYGREILCTGALLRLLVEIGRAQRQDDALNPSPVTPEDPRVVEWMQYLDRHLAEDLDMDDLAERFFISKFHMMRLFRAHTGFTVHTYLLQRRLLAARQLIEQGMRATEACYRCGFRSYSSFTRAYNQHFGTTPTGRMTLSQQEPEGAE